MAGDVIRDDALSALDATTPELTYPMDFRVDGYGALYVVQTNAAGVALPTIPAESTILASAARTTLQNVSVTNSAGYRGVHVVIDTTLDPSTASITPSIQWYSTLGDDWITVLTGAAIAGTGVIMLSVFPGAVAAANTVADGWLPPTWRFSMAVADAESMTYSVNAILLP